MLPGQEYNTYTTTSSVPEYDMGLRTFLLGVFNNMTIALFISGIVSAYIGFSPELAAAIWGTPFKWVAIFAPLAFVFLFSFMASSMSSGTARIMLFCFAGLIGLSISSIFLIYKLGSIAQVFFISGTTFGATALWGYTTKRDLSSMGSFLMMGVIGLLIAGVVNIFLQSSVMAFVISLIGVLIFVGFTAYDMQSIKEQYYELHDDEELRKAGVFGALNLYMDFVNIFMNLLQLLGEKK
jgi:FtsH-binding integral membrane protein